MEFSAYSPNIYRTLADNLADNVATGAFVEAFAAGALLTMIADEMAPEAYERSQVYAGLATVAGFTFALWLTSLE